MSLSAQHRFRSFLPASLFPVAIAGMAAALLAAPAVRWIDDRTRWTLLGIGADGARAVLGALSASLLTFIVFVFSTLLLVVQVAGAQLSPRVVARVFERPLTKLTLAAFVFSFTYSLAALGRVEDPVPQLPVLLAILSSLAGVALFLFLIQSACLGFRPISVLTRVGEETREAIETIYPHPFPRSEGTPAEPAPGLPPDAKTIVHHGKPGVVLAFDAAGLTQLAVAAGCVVVLVPQVGDFVAAGDELFRLHGSGAAAADAGALSQCVALGPERSLGGDPAFGVRIIVDIAIKALSPAINDPTTAVLAIDQLSHLLRLLGSRRLDSGVVRDEAGQVLLRYRTPGWEDFVALAVTEIRLCAGTSVAVYRRLQAMFDHLVLVLPEERAALLREEALLMHRTVERSLDDPTDRALAVVGDLQGLGSPVRISAPEAGPAR